MDEHNGPGTTRSGFSGAQVVAVVLLALAVAGLGAFWVVRSYVFPEQFDIVELTESEQQVLERKLARLGRRPPAAGKDRLAPEPYSEKDADREIVLTEKEVNSVISDSPELAGRAAVDFSDSLASAKMLILLDPDFPVLGGRTLRLNAGLELAFSGGRPIVRLRGVSLMGVPVPNAWLGELKNVDLVAEFGADAGFWKAFADGVEELRVEEKRIHIRLRE